MNGNPQIDTPPLLRMASPVSKSESNPQRLVLKTRLENFHQSSSPAPPGSSHPTFHTSSNGAGSRRPRPETSHQKAVNMNRKMRIDHILHNKIRHVYRDSREQRSRCRSSFGLMVMNRVKDLPDMYDSDDENAWGPGGLLQNRSEFERDDFGEEAQSYKKAIERAIRRLERQDNPASTGGIGKQYGKGKKKGPNYVKSEEKERASRKRRRDEGSRHVDVNGNGEGGRHEEALDDLDLALLGEGQEQEEQQLDEESGGDDTEDGEMTEDEVMNEV